MTRMPGRRGGKLCSRGHSGKPDDTKKPEVAAGLKKCHCALAPLPNVRRQRRAKRVRCTPGLGNGMGPEARTPAWQGRRVDVEVLKSRGDGRSGGRVGSQGRRQTLRSGRAVMSATMGGGRVREGGSRGEQRSPRAEPAGSALRKARQDEEARTARRETLVAGRLGEAGRHEEA